MGGQIDTPTTPLRMETSHLLEDGSTRPHLSIHHPQSSLDGPGIQVSKSWLGLGEGFAHSLHWDLLSMAISQVEPTLKPYDTYLPPLNSHRVQDATLNNLDEAHRWMQLLRPEATDDREYGNPEFLCTLKHSIPRKNEVSIESL